jgi:hypothetical protein
VRRIRAENRIDLRRNLACPAMPDAPLALRPVLPVSCRTAFAEYRIRPAAQIPIRAVLAGAGMRLHVRRRIP